MKMRIARFSAAVALVLTLGISPAGVGNAYASETSEEEPVTTEKVYEYGKVIEKNITTDIPVVPGTNYRIKVTFTGIEAEGKTLNPVRIYYEDVMYDQCVPNVQPAYKAKNVDDRSGLLYEVTTPGVTDSREFTVAAIDDVLTVIVAGDAILEKVEIRAEEAKEPGKKPTIYVIGDSLVQTYNSSYYPMTGWGQMLPQFFTKDVNIVNRAIGGRSTMNFINQGRLNDVLVNVRPGDCVLVTFGHNDGGGVAGRACSVEDYKMYLKERYVEGVRQRGGTTVLVTLGNQNIFSKEGEVLQSYPDYVNAMKEAAAEMNCPLIDLNAKSKAYFKSVYDEYGSGFLKDVVFNCFRAGIYENYIDGAGDSTHFQKFGATKLSEFVARGIAELELPGVSEYYKAPAAAEAVPANVGDVKFNTKKYDEKYFHMEWKTVKGADFYEIERASMNREGFITGFELLGYAAEGMFADPPIKREEGMNYAYVAYGVNAAGRSEKPSEILWAVADNDIKEEFRTRLEAGEIGARKEEETAKAEQKEEAVTQTASHTPVPKQEERSDDDVQGKDPVPIILTIAGIFVAAACAVVLIGKRKK